MKKKIAIFGLMLILGLGKLVMAEVWEEIRPSGTGTPPSPSKRNGHVLISPDGSEKFVFGGFDQDPDLWILWQEGETWRWEYRVAQGTAPTKRGGHIGIFVRQGLGQDYIIIFGGSQSPLGVPVDTDTYKLDNPWDWGSEWEILETTNTVPPLRAEHTTVYDDGMNRMVVFGGYTNSVTASSETYTLDFSVIPASWTKLNTNGEIPARYGHSAVWAGWRMVVFGGKDSSGSLLNDCRWFDLESKEWTQESVTGDEPPARWQHTAVWMWGSLGEPGGMFVFGGEDKDGKPFDDFWILREPGPGEPNWKWEKIYPIGDLPSARAGHAAAVSWGWEGQQMFIFGGSGKNGDLNDVYAFFRGEKVKETLQKKPFNAPNPFSPDIRDTKICYYLDKDDNNVKIKLFTLTGELVYSWENIPGRKGLNQESWDGRNEKGRIVENGGYICLIEAGGKKQKCKIAVLR